MEDEKGKEKREKRERRERMKENKGLNIRVKKSKAKKLCRKPREAGHRGRV